MNKDITALQAKAILASVRSRDVVWRTRLRLAAEQLADLVAVGKRISLVEGAQGDAQGHGSTPMELPGVAPIVATRVLADVGDMTGFADR